MNSISAGPGTVCDVAPQGGDGRLLCSIKSVTMAGSVSIGAGAGEARADAGARVPTPRQGSERDEVVAVDNGLQRVRGSAVRTLPMGEQVADAVGRRCQAGATSTNSRPPASYIGRGVVSCHMENPSGFIASVIIWVTDGEVDVVLLIAGPPWGWGECRRLAPDDREVLVDEHYLIVLGSAEMRFDQPAKLHEPHDLPVRQGRAPSAVPVDRPFARSARRVRRGLAVLLGGYVLSGRLRRPAPCRRRGSPGRTPRPASASARSWSPAG